MRVWLAWLGLAIAMALSGRASPASSIDAMTLIIVVGAPGEPEYGSNFIHQASLWDTASQQAGCAQITIGLDAVGATNDLDRLQLTLATQQKTGTEALWLVLIGHGTFDGNEARFNLRGPDLSATDLALWLQPFQRPSVVINTASASAPFLNRLSATNRVIVTATRSGYEQNYARFGQFLAEAIASPQSDLDQDGQTSLLEAFLAASHRVVEFYQTEGRLATEHALIDDNGDGLGTPADWFRGIRAIKKAADGASLDGVRAHQFHLVRSAEEQRLPPAIRAQRDELELSIARLRDTKLKIPEDEYYRKLETLLLDLGRLYEQTAPSR